MTLTTTTPMITLDTDGNTVAFDFDFKMWTATVSTELTVIFNEGESDEKTLESTTDYTLSAPNNDYSSGGTVTLVAGSAYIADGNTITIKSALVRSQTYNLLYGGELNTDNLEDVLDRQIRIAQEVELRGAIEGTAIASYMKSFLTSISAADARTALLLGWIDVRAYGAVGDGATDDTVAIQAAIDVVEAAGGGIVSLPGGTYLLNDTPGLVVDSDNVILQGVGAASIIKEGSSFSASYLITIKGSGTYVSHCGIKDLQVLGVSTDGTSGIYISNSWKAKLENVLVQDLSDGVVIKDDGEGAWWTQLWNVRCINCRNSSDTGHGLWIKKLANETSVFGGEMHTCNVAVEIGTWNALANEIPVNVNFFAVAFESGSTRPWTYNPTAGAVAGDFGLVIHGININFYGCRFEDDVGNDILIGEHSYSIKFDQLASTAAADLLFHADFNGSVYYKRYDSLTERYTSYTHKDGDNFHGEAGDLSILITRVKGDDVNRFTRDIAGKMYWGGGSSALDTTLYRAAVGTLKTDGSLVKGIGTLADNATPSVIGKDIWLTGGTTTITDFDDGVTGQVITVIAEHSLDITDGTNIFLSGSTTWTMTATDTLTLICKADLKWYEISRSDSGA